MKTQNSQPTSNSKLAKDDPRRFLPKDQTGFKVWRNRQNGFVVAELHYSADPKKRDPRWKANASRGMPTMDWEREYELNWETHSGKPVYGSDFHPQLHVYVEDIEHTPGTAIVRGWDFGLTPACVIMELVGRRVNVIAEEIGINLGAARFVPQVLGRCKTLFSPGEEVFDFVDPAGFNRSESEETSCVDVMVRNGLRPVAGEMTYEKRLGAVLEHLTRFEGGHPLLMLNPQCKVLIAGFRGGYQYPEPSSKRSVVRMDRPLKNAFSHPHDALQYGISKIAHLQNMVGRPRLRLQSPNYSFQGD